MRDVDDDDDREERAVAFFGFENKTDAGNHRYQRDKITVGTDGAVG